MQAVISIYSKSKHHNPAEPEADLTGVEHDEVGLVQAICVKAHSSVKCKRTFITIQKWGRVKIVHHLLINIAVHWSSTYVMTSQAEATCPHADNVQQAFSSDWATTLHLALPILEASHKAWSKLLDPSQKTEHTHKYWGDDKLESILENAKEMYKKCYFEMYGNNSAPASLQ
ncbi:hypothetical protein F5148DRAFT_1147405 [Russula earlei]|uniref:Uncharacterized protein n=1 Tax=Russula earlei TaxID=71964 RepID=A0ACC0UH87_9AGAM|nr:hypothetical protein F5148DRAFT_1147405 [Russula earlei]